MASSLNAPLDISWWIFQLLESFSRAGEENCCQFHVLDQAWNQPRSSITNVKHWPKDCFWFALLQEALYLSLLFWLYGSQGTIFKSLMMGHLVSLWWLLYIIERKNKINIQTFFHPLTLLCSLAYSEIPWPSGSSVFFPPCTRLPALCLSQQLINALECHRVPSLQTLEK